MSRIKKTRKLTPNKDCHGITVQNPLLDGTTYNRHSEVHSGDYVNLVNEKGDLVNKVPLVVEEIVTHRDGERFVRIIDPQTRKEFYWPAVQCEYVASDTHEEGLQGYVP